jgi:hypothetical protein
MRGLKVLRGAVLALGVVAPIVVGAAGQAQAAAGSDLDLTKCSIVDDPVDYGDGIDWYKLQYTIVNEGSAPTNDFVSRARPVYGVNEFGGGIGNEVHTKFTTKSLGANQSTSGFFWLTKKTVDQKTWGIFLDINHQTGESQTNDSFCSAFVNNS